MIKKKILSTLLHYANRYPYLEKGDIFYEIKTSILAHNAKQLGKQVQHIVKKCYSCNGTGVFSEYYDGWNYTKLEPRTCYNCNHGVYDQFYSLLVLWQFGSYQFHTFIDRINGPLFSQAYFKDLPLLEPIEGKVKKEPVKNWLHREAYLWLILIYKQDQFLKRLKKSCPCGRVYTPLCLLNKIVFRYRNWNLVKRRWKAKLRRFKSLFIPKKKLVSVDDSDLPF